MKCPPCIELLGYVRLLPGDPRVPNKSVATIRHPISELTGSKKTRFLSFNKKNIDMLDRFPLDRHNKKSELDYNKFMKIHHYKFLSYLVEYERYTDLKLMIDHLENDPYKIYIH